MGVRNRRPDLNGVLVIDKPYGWTSAKAVAFARRATGGAKVGHAGTLDPLATGVLVLCIGKATKMVERFMNAAKSYRAVIDLSRVSESHDLERDTAPVQVDSPPDRATVERVLHGFVGTIQQVPPAHSAAKMGGKRAYDLARRGKLVDAGPPTAVGGQSSVRGAGEPDEGAVEQTDATPSLSPKLVRIDAITVLKYEWPMLELDIDCGRGTYVRSLVRDLAHALGTGGVLTGLVRTRSGSFCVEQAQPASVFDRSIEAELLMPFEFPPQADQN
jgi:tRNA pseudouridine55 synthase